MKKFLKWFFISLALLFVLLLAVPFLFKGKIIELVKTEVNKNLNATVAFDDDISIGIISSFPDLNVSIKKISVANKGDFERQNDE